MSSHEKAHAQAANTRADAYNGKDPEHSSLLLGLLQLLADVSQRRLQLTRHLRQRLRNSMLHVCHRDGSRSILNRIPALCDWGCLLLLALKQIRHLLDKAFLCTSNGRLNRLVDAVRGRNERQAGGQDQHGRHTEDAAKVCLHTQMS